MCRHNMLLCAHKWLQGHLGNPGRAFITQTPERYTAMMRQALVEAVALTPNDAVLWTTHVSRRGAAAHILRHQQLSGEGGIKAMLREGDWAPAASAHPYTPKEEVDEVRVLLAKGHFNQLSEVVITLHRGHGASTLAMTIKHYQ